MPDRRYTGEMQPCHESSFYSLPTFARTPDLLYIVMFIIIIFFLTKVIIVAANDRLTK